MLGFKKKRIYLDTAATTPVDLRAVKAMEPFLTGDFGNPSSLHQEGVAAQKAMAEAREGVAQILGAHADEIIFTGSGTESDNLAILGVARGLLAKNKIKQPGHIIVSAIEHRAVLESCAQLEREGWRIDYLTVDDQGIVKLDELEKKLRPDTALVSVMYANNEIGTIQPIREIAKFLRHWRSSASLRGYSRSNLEIASSAGTPSRNDIQGERLPYFHTDACQAPRFLPLGVEQLGVDLLTLNGSKIYGPKGVGCLFVRRNTFIEPIIVGGGQERGLRSGTENVAGIVGFATALKIAAAGAEKESTDLEAVRDYFIAELRKISGVVINGHLAERLPNNINVTFPGVPGELAVLWLDAQGIAASTGSACSTHHKDDAHVIMSLGKNRDYADRTVRFSLDRGASKADVDYTVRVIKEILQKNRKINL
ncbi:MAG: cysteine desulfurase family protein [Candidatus Vogelbacteria bacterium]|nr:cysteine desulfurase family protein [Candidatus Vogelbacteria bacterium]